METSRGDGVEFVSCAIDIHVVFLNSSCATLVEEEAEVDAPQLNEESEFGLVNLFFPKTVKFLKKPQFGLGIWLQPFT